MSNSYRKGDKKSNGAKGKLKKSVISVIVTAAVMVAIIISLLITNIFIPVKYLSAYCVKPHKNRKGTLRVNYLNVDFGDCTLIELPDGKSILIDGGDGAYPNMLRVLKFLNYRGIDKIDYLVCTSVKSEHCGGLAEIVKYKEVGFAYVPYCLNTRINSEFHSFISELNRKSVPCEYACVGESIVGDDYFFTFLSPTNYLSPYGEYAALNSDPNIRSIENASAVTWLEYDGVSFAFTSDIRSEGLERIVEEYNASVALGQPYCPAEDWSVALENCKIVTAPAHAGGENTYAPWYDLTKPEQAIISVGKSYAGYPSAQALSDICNYCQPKYTMYDGNITVIVKDGGYTIN